MEEIIGKNYFDIHGELEREIEIAILGSIFNDCYQLIPESTYSLLFPAKSVDRAQIVVTQIEELVRQQKNVSKKYDVVNVGIIGLFLKLLSEKHYNVIGTDFDRNIIDTTFYDVVSIVDGKHTLDYIAQAKVAAITGMTLTTNTIDDIIKCAQKYNTKLLVFAETGFNLSKYYLQEGVDVVVCEHFPFYIFDGESIIEIYKTNK